MDSIELYNLFVCGISLERLSVQTGIETRRLQAKISWVTTALRKNSLKTSIRNHCLETSASETGPALIPFGSGGA